MNASGPTPISTRVHYPNRRLGFQIARTSEEDEYSGRAMANVALANLRRGETVRLGGALATVAAIGAKPLTLIMPDGKRRRIGPYSSQWEQLVRDVDGDLLGFVHSRGWGKEPDVVKAL